NIGSSDSYGVALGDLDSDGDIDAFVANLIAPNKIWINDGSASFTEAQSLTDASVSVALGDVDADGDLDAFVGNISNEAAIQGNRVWFNNGSGLFTTNNQLYALTDTYDLALGDIDLDGDIDVFFANYSGLPDEVWLNDGSGTFSNSGQLLGQTSSQSVALGDLDQDGDLDAFVANDGVTGISSNKIWIRN
ncbi:MAG: hypothetical protein ACI9BD_001546, partial [Candidatus Marinamargulisbacteria bacterium]